MLVRMNGRGARATGCAGFVIATAAIVACSTDATPALEVADGVVVTPGQPGDPATSPAGGPAGPEENGSGNGNGNGNGGPVASAVVAPSGPFLLQLLTPSKIADLYQRLPKLYDGELKTVLQSNNTIWYDKSTIIPGYQDSFGDNVQLPIGFRPNSIDPQMINLAVPGGHAQLFEKRGIFHFPFSTTGGAEDAPNAHVVDFWAPPLDAQGKPLPVVWWKREPNGYTHKYVWTFPKGTVFGEVLLIDSPKGETYVYEIRTRTRELDHWRVDAFRPFPRATDLATALQNLQAQTPALQGAPQINAMVSHLATATNLAPASLAATHYTSSWATQDGARDVLPDLGDEALVGKLLRETPFVSVRNGAPWKDSGTLATWAPTTNAPFSIVPKNYKGGFLAVNDTSCERCHSDAGHPFVNYYPNVVAYGELWGEDETFSWHPFEAANFVDANGEVKNFNYDNRVMRADFVAKGLVVKYDAQKHAATTYKEIPRAWRSFAY